MNNITFKRLKMKNLVYIIPILLVIFFTIDCGKKGPLKLEPVLDPPPVTNFKVSQVGANLKLQWEFPTTFSDKKKTELLTDKIDKIQIYYSTKELPGNKYAKKASIIRKLKLSDISITEESVTVDNSKKRKTEVTKTTCSFSIPFKLQDLDNKNHWFSVQYFYHKRKSPICDVVFFRTIVPVQPVSNITLNRERKVVKIKWGKPNIDESGKPVPSIAGYDIYKKSSPTKQDSSVPQNENTFKKLNSSPILREYFEDTDTGTDGVYYYYISAIILTGVETAPSQIIELDISDIYPPEVPANVVVFRGSDHMAVTWGNVEDPDLDFYRVYRKTSDKDNYKLLVDKVNSNSYTDKNIKNGVTYYYTITAVDKKGNESQHSQEVKEQF